MQQIRSTPLVSQAELSGEARPAVVSLQCRVALQLLVGVCSLLHDASWEASV